MIDLFDPTRYPLAYQTRTLSIAGNHLRLKYTKPDRDSRQPVAGELTGSEHVPLVKAGITRRVTSAGIAAIFAQIFVAFEKAEGPSLSGMPVGSLQSAAHGLPTMADMKALTKATILDGQRVTIQGFYAAGDGGGGHFA